ncbi:hypothetical protein PROFUN_01332 [Planoprotostelium fungivorum]|uniref:Uncharacterized protein n=1 Tax=Planoprotostelium fungivorum TaxID=1890364 RepID=A0A2P6NZW9_9EUKA|nr:hypothetical protein PROFUN_01332 [Planoprotostelium fungivorum]
MVGPLSSLRRKRDHRESQETLPQERETMRNRQSEVERYVSVTLVMHHQSFFGELWSCLS